MSAAELLHRAGTNLLLARPARRLAFWTARARRRAMVLVYHRVTPEGKQPHEVVPNVTVAVFRAQVEVLATIGEVVPLAVLLAEPPAGSRLRFAITFDDDEPSHLLHAIPALRSLGIPATFFLSGRSLHGLGSYWWMLLERLIEVEGLARAGAALGFSAQTPEGLAAACEQAGPGISARLAALVREGPSRILGPEDYGVFPRSGMEVGFHTLHHPILTTLGETELDRAVQAGRAELAGAVGGSLDMFAYPHGRANPRVTAAVRSAGYRAGFRSGRRPVDPQTDRYLLGRWDIGSVALDRLPAYLALRLNYPTGGRPE